MNVMHAYAHICAHVRYLKQTHIRMPRCLRIQVRETSVYEVMNVQIVHKYVVRQIFVTICEDLSHFRTDFEKAAACWEEKCIDTATVDRK